jgi:phosphatidylglycerol---prolipoprotein diacylglyceryl transferase
MTNLQFPVYIHIGSLTIHPHIFFESLAYFISLRLILMNSKKDTILPEQRTTIIVGGFIGALIGAKLLVLLQHFYLFNENPQLFLLLILQGKTVVGAILGGLIGVEITKKIIHVTTSTGDLFVYPLILGTAIGRVGCFLTGISDRTYGTATNLPWGVDFGDGIYRHPTQVYEIIFLLMLWGFLNIRSKYAIANGDLFKIYLISYCTFRLLIDFIKPDFHPILGLSPIQIACLITVIYYHKTMIKLVKISP